MANGKGGRLGAIGSLDLGENVVHVIGHGFEADAQSLRGLTVALAGGDEVEYLNLASGQTAGIGSDR